MIPSSSIKTLEVPGRPLSDCTNYRCRPSVLRWTWQMIQRLTVLMETFINWNMNVVRHSFLTILLLLLLAVFLLGSSFPLFARHFYVIEEIERVRMGRKRILFTYHCFAVRETPLFMPFFQLPLMDRRRNPAWGSAVNWWHKSLHKFRQQTPLMRAITCCLHSIQAKTLSD